MRAVTIPHFGDADVLTIAEVPEPAAGPGQIAIDVTHAGVNFAEVLYRRGAVPVELPFVPGIEVAGHVRSLGAGVEGPPIGAPVAALTMVDGGGYAEIVVTDARSVAVLPGSPADEQLARFAAGPSNTTTAFLVLDDVARLRSGESVLVHAATGGLGSQIGQVARLLGAGRVVGTVGDETKRARALDLGYDEVILRPDLSRSGDRFDLVVDPVGGPARARSLAMLHPGGRLLAVGNASGADDVALNANEAWFAGIGVLGHNTALWAARRPDDVGAALRRAIEAVADGSVRIDVEATMPLAAAPAAHREIESGRSMGKIVLDLAGG